MSTAVRRSATLLLLLALLLPGLMTVTSGTAHADVRLDRRAVDDGSATTCAPRVWTARPWR